MLTIFTIVSLPRPCQCQNVSRWQGKPVDDTMKDVAVEAAPVLEGTFVRSTRILQGTGQRQGHAEVMNDWCQLCVLWDAVRHYYMYNFPWMMPIHVPDRRIHVEHLRLLSWSFSCSMLQSTKVATCCASVAPRFPAHGPSIDTLSALDSRTPLWVHLLPPAGVQAQKMGSPRARPLTIWASSAEPKGFCFNAPPPPKKKKSMWKYQFRIW